MYIVEQADRNKALLKSAPTIDHILKWLSGVCAVWMPIFTTIPDHLLTVQQAKDKGKELSAKRKLGQLQPSEHVKALPPPPPPKAPKAQSVIKAKVVHATINNYFSSAAPSVE